MVFYKKILFIQFIKKFKILTKYKTNFKLSKNYLSLLNSIKFFKRVSY